MVRVEELRILHELTRPQTGDDAAVRVRKHQALDGPKTSILQEYMPARSGRIPVTSWRRSVLGTS
jgi:hypothetical protein